MGQKPAETATALVVAVADIGSLAGTTRSQTVRRTLQILGTDQPRSRLVSHSMSVIGMSCQQNSVLSLKYLFID